MPEAKLEERKERLACPVDETVIGRIRAMQSPYEVAHFIGGFQAEEAVAIIDNLDLVTAACVFEEFRKAAVYHTLGLPQSRLEHIVKLGRELRIRGSLGLFYMRDRMTKLMVALDLRVTLDLLE